MKLFNSHNFPLVMGIVNITPDSFSDGGKITNVDSAVEHSLKMLDWGVDIIDIGGESTRPGSEPVNIETELNRVIPIIKNLKKINSNIKISIDTTKYEVAKEALDCGANFLNDISGLRFEPKLADLAYEYNVPLILMHSRENPKIMQNNPFYNDTINEVKNELKESIKKAESKKISKIIIDPGIGFAKGYEHNIEIINNIDKFYNLNYPILLGISRKAFIGHILKEKTPEKRDIGTLIIHSLLLKFKIDFIRVHNVELISKLKTIYNALNL